MTLTNVLLIIFSVFLLFFSFLFPYIVDDFLENLSHNIHVWERELYEEELKKRKNNSDEMNNGGDTNA